MEELKWPATARLWAAALAALLAAAVVAAERRLRSAEAVSAQEVGLLDYVPDMLYFLWRPDDSSYQHVWPPMEFGWKIAVGTIIGFLGSAFGTVGGVGGGGIYVPMLMLIIGFDAKSSAAISKCMIMGAAGSTVWFNLKLRHPTLDMPIIDYDLALLFQPMLMLGISIGVTFNVIFADWMVTVLLIFLFVVTSTKAFLKGIETWKRETILNKEAAMLKESNGRDGTEYKALPLGPGNESNNSLRTEVPVIENICWKELGLLCFVWVAFLALQIAKQNYTSNCSLWYWILNLLQVPVSLVVSVYEAVNLYKGKRIVSSKGDQEGANFTVPQLVLYCSTVSYSWRAAWPWRRVYSRPCVLGAWCSSTAAIAKKVYMEEEQLNTFEKEKNKDKWEQREGLDGKEILLLYGCTSCMSTTTEKGFLLGLKCYSNFCNDIFFIHVRRRILPFEAFPRPICIIFCGCCNIRCLHWPICG